MAVCVPRSIQEKSLINRKDPTDRLESRLFLAHYNGNHCYSPVSVQIARRPAPTPTAVVCRSRISMMHDRPRPANPPRAPSRCEVRAARAGRRAHAPAATTRRGARGARHHQRPGASHRTSHARPGSTGAYHQAWRAFAPLSARSVSHYAECFAGFVWWASASGGAGCLAP